MKRIVFDGKKCAGCSICAVACMDENNFSAERDSEPLRLAGETEQDGVFTQYSASCLHCGACIAACPRGCISRDAQTGFVLCDNTDCIGCRGCLRVCPVSAPKFGADSKMRKCDGCISRVLAGLEPACVRACPTGALRFSELGSRR